MFYNTVKRISLITSPKDFEAILERYNKAQDWLLSLIIDIKGERYKEEKSPEQRLSEYQTNIHRMEEFLDFIGNPQTKFKSVHIAGTSGKGSVAVMLANILSAAGYSTGYHISPYLQVCNEKLIIDRKMISSAEFAEVVFDFRDLYLAWQAQSTTYLTIKYGEAWVALTYYWLARRNVDWGIIETGLGGRFDPTNVLPSSLSIITNVDFDHVKSIGPDLENIAWHKSGIIKENQFVIVGEQNPMVIKIIEKEAKTQQSKVYRLGVDFNYSMIKDNHKSLLLNVDTPNTNYKNMAMPLLGTHQASNASLAVAAVDLLAQEFELDISPEAVINGLADTNFPGRFEIIQQDPIVLLDGAHNPHKMQSLVNTLHSNFSGKRIIVCIGVLSVKDVSGMIKVIDPLVDTWVATQPNVLGKPAMPVEELIEHIKKVSPNKKIFSAGNIQSGLDIAFDRADPDTVIVVTGSLYLVGDARERWNSKKQLLLEIEAGNRF